MNTTACTCGNCPTIRMERGLPPFCTMPAPPSRPTPGYATQEECKAAHPLRAAIPRNSDAMGHGVTRYFPR